MYGIPNPYAYQPMMNQQQIIRVNGEPGAQALNLPPNASALVLDETAPIVWLCKTDGAGYKTVMPFSITKYTPAPKPDLNALSERITRLEERINESDTGRVKPARAAAVKQRTANVSSISGSVKPERVSSADDAEEPDTGTDCE